LYFIDFSSFHLQQQHQFFLVITLSVMRSDSLTTWITNVERSSASTAGRSMPAQAVLSEKDTITLFAR
jgi:hypothetical protein